MNGQRRGVSYIYDIYDMYDIYDIYDICVCIHTHTHTREYYSAIKKNEILPFAATWIELQGIMLSEISQTEKDKHCMISLTCGI